MPTGDLPRAVHKGYHSSRGDIPCCGAPAGLAIDGMRDGSIRPVDAVIAGEFVNSIFS